MSDGIKIGAEIEAKDFIRGAGDMADALEDVSKELKDTSKDGEVTVDNLTDSFEKLAKQAKETGNTVGKATKSGTKEAESGLKDFKDEANSTAKESAASFDGSAESIVGSFQEIAANAFAGFGPAGAIAGLALAAGIGIGTAEFQKSQEEAQKTKERIQELATAFIETGDTASIDVFLQSLKDIVTESDNATKSFKDIQKEAKDLQLDANALATAYAGGQEAIDGQVAAIDDLIKAQSKQYTEGNRGEQSRSQAGLEQITQLQKTKEELQKVADETRLAKEAEDAWLASGGAEVQAKADAISQINAAYDEAVFSVDNFKNAETGIYDLDAYAASIEERARLLQEYQSNLADSGLTTEQKAALNEMGVEQANAILNGLKDPNTSQATKDTIKNGLKTASQEGSGVAKKEIEDAFKKPISAKIEAKADTATAEADLEAITKKRIAQIQVQFTDRYGKEIYP